jgi:ParB family chromosome partitioning protein
MSPRAKKLSPVLGAASAMIGEASLSLVSAGSAFSHSFEVEIDRVRPDPAQARRDLDPDALASLAATLREEGQLQPILLRPDASAPGHWIIVAGERRWRAARMNGWKLVLAIVHHGDAEVAALIENLQRVDLAPLEEARGIERLLRGKGWTQEQAARALGKGISDISGTLRILRLPEPLLTELLTSELPPAKNVLIELARVDDAASLARLAALARTGGLTVKAIRAARAAAEARAEQDPAWRARAEEAGAEEAGAEESGAGQGRAAAELRAVGRALRIVTRLASGAGMLPDEMAGLLHRLRDAADAALARPAGGGPA